jgi:hypothetical protein
VRIGTRDFAGNERRECSGDDRLGYGRSEISWYGKVKMEIIERSERWQRGEVKTGIIGSSERWESDEITYVAGKGGRWKTEVVRIGRVRETTDGSTEEVTWSVGEVTDENSWR